MLLRLSLLVSRTRISPRNVEVPRAGTTLRRVLHVDRPSILAPMNQSFAHLLWLNPILHSHRRRIPISPVVNLGCTRPRLRLDWRQFGDLVLTRHLSAWLTEHLSSRDVQRLDKRTLGRRRLHGRLVDDIVVRVLFFLIFLDRSQSLNLLNFLVNLEGVFSWVESHRSGLVP